MGTIFVSIILVLVIIYIVPFIIYGIASVVTKLEPPKGVSPKRFLVSVLISKIGTSICFVLLYYIAREAIASQFLPYAGIWLIMIILGEIGQAIGPNYSWKEAILGIISEIVYVPLSAYLIFRILG
jgi:hypothetical protein